MPPLPSRLPPFLSIPRRTFIDARVKWVRDRSLDLVVETEKHLQPFHALKDFLLLPSSSSSSGDVALPSVAALRLPFRPLRFIRLFPSAFDLLPSSPHPVVRPTDALARLHADEQIALALPTARSDASSRLLRLLMLSPRRCLSLSLVHRLSWDLGLPPRFPRSLLLDFPDHFRIVPSAAGCGDLDLEVVCYRSDLAVSALERCALRNGEYRKGMAIAFPLRFSKGFDLEKKVRRWVDEWQMLPYVSPYEDGSCLDPRSDVAEKWAVGVIHEVLSLFVGKKTEKENLVLVGEHLGLPRGFPKMITHHPGIFYVSNKLRTQTVVLREAYRKDLLVEKHPLMGLRYQYIHLMHKGKEVDDRRSRRAAFDYDAIASAKGKQIEVEEGVEEDESSVSSDFSSEEENVEDDCEAFINRKIAPARSSGSEISVDV